MAGPLQGVGILVTRPACQADELCRTLAAAGGRVIRCPVM
ncbi:MAG: uroporphyrinogen-III synthase, partial [Woeseiaceae bacterium]|nr:uroporphyrinogen-III synthase [Woeseiaceae bacterium]